MEKWNSGYFKMNVVKQNRTPSLSLCLAINSTNLNCCTEQCSNLKQLSEFVESEKSASPRKIIERAHQINLTSYFVTNFAANHSVIFIKYRSICIKYYEDSVPADEANYSLANPLNLSVSLYMHEQLYPEIYNNYLTHLQCNEHGCANLAIEIWEFQINYLPELMGCINYTQHEFEFQRHELIDSKEVCLFECLKSMFGFRPIDFLYTADDEKILTPANWTKLDPDDLRKCKAFCSRQHCNTNYFLVKKFRKANHTSLEISLLLYTEELFFISSYNFLLQLLNFVCLIFGTSILSFLNKLIYLSALLTRSPKLNLFKLVFILSWTFILSLLCLSFLNFPASIGRLYAKELEKNFEFELEKLFVPFKICLCFNLGPLLGDHYLSGIDNELIKANYLDQLDLNDLIKFPFNLSHFIERLYLDDGYKEMVIDLNGKTSETYFKISPQNQIEKCFSALVSLQNSESDHFRSLFPTTRLKIRYKHANFRVYFIGANHQLTQTNREINFARSITREQKSRLDCKRYDGIVINMHVAFRINCTSRQFCFDRCFNHLVSESTLRLPFGVIAEQEFALLRHAKLNFKAFESEIRSRGHRKIVYQTNSTLFKIEKYCRQLTMTSDCEETEYRPGSELDVELQNKKLTLNIFPDANIETERELHGTDFLELISRGASFYTVLLGISFFDAIRILTKLFNLKNKFKEVYLLKTIFLLALAYHLKSILNIVFLESKFTESFFISKDFNGKDFPAPNLCFTNHHLNSNRLLTGTELSRLTNNISFPSFVESVEFLNDRSEYETWYPNETDRKVNFKIEMFFYLRKKCYKIIYNLNASSHKNDSSLVYLMRINFRQDQPKRKLYFFSSHRNPNSVNYFNQIDMTKSYFIDNKLTYIRFYDNVQYFFKPVLFLMEGYKFRSEDYLGQLKQEFSRRMGHATTLLTLTRDYHHLPINNSLFELFFRQQFRKKLNFLKNSNFERLIYKDIILVQNNESHSLLVKKVRYKRLYVKERKDTVVSFFCDLLSSVSLCLGYGLFELINRTIDSLKKLILKARNILIHILFALINVTIKIVIKIDGLLYSCKAGRHI